MFCLCLASKTFSIKPLAAVVFDGLCKTYPDGHPALIDLNLSIGDGELMVFVGPSGCGKSTLLRLLAGLEQISSGRIWIGGKVANQLSPQERNIAMVFQDYALYPNMTVRGNLEFPLKMRKLSQAEIHKRMSDVAAMLGIEDILERFPKQLSGGQRQRVAMGRALVREPAVFLLDEPLSNLDAKLRVKVRAEIGELQKRLGTTMVYVTHDQVEAMTLGQRIAVLNRGRLQQVGSPWEIYEKPANTFVAGFIGSPPMNLFPTQLCISRDGKPLIKLGTQELPVNIPAEDYFSLASHTLIAGIRPESFRLAAKGEWGFLAVAEWIEYLGHETIMQFRPEGMSDVNGCTPLVARFAGRQTFQKGETYNLVVDAFGIHIFDYHSEIALN